MAINLSRITKINPREIWKHEALDFTQWLAKEENISILCEELEINVENIKSEASAVEKCNLKYLTYFRGTS